MASEVDSEPLTIDRTLFRLNEDDNVEDIPGLDDMPSVIRNTLLKHRSMFSNDLSASRKIKCDPQGRSGVAAEVQEGAVNSPPLEAEG